LVEKCGVPGKSGVRNEAGKRLDEAQKFLADNGFSYGISMLTVLRDVSAKFPASKRLEAVTWSAHKEFIKNPNDLPKLHKKWAKDHPGETFTVAVAKALIKGQEAKTAAEPIKKSENAGKKSDEQETTTATTTDQPAAPQPEPINTKPEEKEPQSNGDGVTTAAAPIEPVTNETWEVEAEVRFSAAVKTMMAELEIINNHAKSGIFGTVWHARTTSDLEILDAAMTKTAELLDTVDDDKRAGDPVIGADNGILIQSTATH